MLTLDHLTLTIYVPENRQRCQGRPACRAFILPLTDLAFSGQSGSRPSYMIASSPYTLPQFRTGIVHFLVASKVER